MKWRERERERERDVKYGKEQLEIYEWQLGSEKNHIYDTSEIPNWYFHLKLIVRGISVAEVDNIKFLFEKYHEF